MAEINRQDIITEEAIRAPLQAAENIGVLMMSINKLIDTTKKSEQSLNGNVSSTLGLTKETQSLVQAQTELGKIQKQYATSTQKLSDEYISNKRALNAVNQEVKERLTLGERDSRAVTAHTSSLNTLDAALQKNKKSYADLAGEQARGSKEGQELLKIIQSQDKASKKLSESLGESQKHVGEYKEAVAFLNEKVGGSIESFKLLGKELYALVANPVVAVLAAIAIAFEVLKSAAEAYYEETLQGEDQLKREILSDDAFFRVYKSLWAEMGESIAQGWEILKLQYKLFVVSISGDEMKKKLIETQTAANKAADQNSLNFKNRTREIVEEAELENKMAKQLEISRDKENYSAKQREEAIIRVRELIEDQLRRKKQIAEDELKAQELVFESQGKTILRYQTYDEVLNSVVTKSTLLKDYSNEELISTKLKGEDLTKLAEAQANVIKVETEASEKRKGLFKQEARIMSEIKAEEKAVLAAEVKAKKDALDKQLKEEGEFTKLVTALHNGNYESRKSGVDKLNTYLITRQQQHNKEMLTEAKKGIKEQARVEAEADRKKIEEEKKVQAALIQLRSQAVLTAATVVANYFEQESLALDARIARLKTAQAIELTNAGNNADAKAKIDSSYAKKFNDLENEQRRVRHDKAVADKAFAAFTIFVKTAEGVGVALSNLNIPLALIIGAIGALQEVAVLTRPIPAFEKGTKSAPGGFALIGEKGSELIYNPSTGKVGLSPDVPTIMDITRGTVIVPHDQTMRQLAMASIGAEAGVNNDSSLVVGVMRALRETIKDSSDRTIKAIENSSTGDLVAQGSLIYEVKKRGDGSKSIIRRKSMSE